MGLLNHQSAVRAVDTNGVPISGARLHIYLSGTDSLARIYEDQHLTYTQENPMKADADGYFAQCFLPGGDYRICLENRLGTTFLSDAEVTVAAETMTTAVPNTAGLQQALDDKADVAHTHSAADVVGLQDVIDMAVSTAAGPMVYRGGWDASSGAFPSNALSGDTFSVTVAGVVDGIAYAPGDQIIANTVDAATISEWDRIRPTAISDRYDTVDHLLADDQGMAVGKTVLVAGGQFTYQVANLTATDYHLTTSGGVKLYALPRHGGGVTAKQIGITDGSNGTAAFTRFVASRLTGITRFICDVDFNLASPSNTGFTVPSIITLEADNVDQIGRGEEATRAIGLMNLISQRADANGLTRRDSMFDAAKFRVRGIRFAHDVEVAPSDIVGNGNGTAVFYDISGTGSGFFAEKCKADFLSGFLLRIDNHPYWRVTKCWAGKPFYFVTLSGRSDHGVFNDNNGLMGYTDSLGSNVYGDYIKVGDNSIDGFGPRFCRVNGNHMVNVLRDGIDSTGGLYGWTITNNIFDVTNAAIDAKQAPNTLAKTNLLERNFKGLTISNNVIIGGEIVFTLNEDLSLYGSTAPEWMHVQGIVASGNTFIPKPGRESCGYYLKGMRGLSVTGDNFTSYRLQKADDFDPATDGAFPFDAVEGTYYEATSAATIDGLAISIGDFVVPTIHGASTTDSADWLIKDTAWLSCSMLRFGTGTAVGYSNQGAWDASAGSFPVATVDGQYWTVSVAGSVDNIRFEVGDYLVSLIDSPSTTNYDANWVRRRTSYTPASARDVSFENIIWDNRGAASNVCTLGGCVNVSMNFASLISDHKAFDIGSTAFHTEISGNVTAYQAEFDPTTAVTLFVIKTDNLIKIDINAEFRSSGGKSFCIVCPPGYDPLLYVDGAFDNWIAAVRYQDPITQSYFGMRSGLEVSNCNFVLTRTPEAQKVDVGLLHTTNITNLTNATTLLTGTILSLKAGIGVELTIEAGAVNVISEVHTIGTLADTSSDGLTTINGGQIGDKLTITNADSARPVIAKDGIGNLTLGGDRMLDELGDTLVLRKHADGNWHEIAFSSVS